VEELIEMVSEIKNEMKQMKKRKGIEIRKRKTTKRMW
jgi:hypothetical protein